MSDRKTRLTVTVDPHLAAYAEQLVKAGKAPSVSAVFNDAPLSALSVTSASGGGGRKRRKGLIREGGPHDRSRSGQGRRTAGPVSEDGAAVLAPYVLDVSVVVAVARGDTEIMTFIQRLDGTGQPMVIPALAITAASLDVRSDEADELLDGLELLGNAEIAPLKGAEQAARLAAVIAATGLTLGMHTWPLSPTRPSARSSPWMPRSGGSTPNAWTSRCTSSRSPTRTRRRKTELGTESSIACRAGTSSSPQPIWRTLPIMGRALREAWGGARSGSIF